MQYNQRRLKINAIEYLNNSFDLGDLTWIMSFYKRSGAVKALLAVVSMLVLMACGGENDVSPPPVSTAAPEAIEATATPVAPMATVVIPTVVPTAAPTAAPTASPTATPTAVPTATPEPPQELNEFGFVMTLDRGAYINSLPTNTDSQGIVQLEYSGVNVILSWVPTDGVTLNGLISGTYDMLQGNQPDLIFDTVSESSITVGIESGSVIGFKSVDGSGEVVGGGLIGAWNCADQDTSFTLMVTGPDAPVVQLRFNRLTGNFACS